MPSVRRKSGTETSRSRRRGDEPDSAPWTFLSNHSHVLLCLCEDPEATLREVADRVGITERSVQRIVTDLESGGYITRTRDGARNRYEVHTGVRLRHPVEMHRTIGDLIRMVHGPSRH